MNVGFIGSSRDFKVLQKKAHLVLWSIVVQIIENKPSRNISMSQCLIAGGGHSLLFKIMAGNTAVYLIM